MIVSYIFIFQAYVIYVCSWCILILLCDSVMQFYAVTFI